MRTFVQKQNQSQKPVSSNLAQSNRAPSGPTLHSHPLLHLQRTIGNQAVLRMLQTDAEELKTGLTGTASPRFGNDFSRIPIHHPPAAIQTKLAINKPGDEYEQEADHVSEQVMRIPGLQLQRACPCGGGCSKCQTEQPGREHESLQTKRVQASDTGQIAAPPIVQEVLRSPGQPLDPATRGFMEPRFGHDFSQVRVHTNAKAAESARAVNALAYTVGRDIVFAAGRYATQTREGRGVLAHELTHTVQQGMESPRLDSLALGEPGTGRGEGEAERVRAVFQAGGEVGEIREYATPTVQRLEGENAGGCGICYGTPANAGTAAHSLISAAYKLQNPTVQAPYPLLASSPGDDNGVLDLAVLTGPDSMAIGEIKPANPAGLLQGDQDLIWYETQLEKLGFKVSRMILPPPIDLIPFPTRSPLPCIPFQEMEVNTPVIGLYTYFCRPGYAQLKATGCKCDNSVPYTPPVPVPYPVWDLLRALSIATGGAVILKKFGDLLPGKKALGAAAALIILLQGKKIAFAGESDPLEAMFEESAKEGEPILDDIKEAIKSDKALTGMLKSAGETGEYDKAKQELSEQLMREIIANRDKFTDADLKELETLAKQSKGPASNVPITAETLRRELDEAKAGGDKPKPEPKPQGQTGDGGSSPDALPAATTSETPTPAAVPPAPAPAAPTAETGAEAELPAPAKRLVSALTEQGAKGPKLDAEGLRSLRRIARSVDPPLSDEEVELLVKKVKSAEGKTADEVLELIDASLDAIRQTEPSEDEKPAEPGAEAGEAGHKPVNVDEGNSFETLPETPDEQLTKEDRDVGKMVANLFAEAQYQSLARGQALVNWGDAVQIKAKQKVEVFFVGRWKDGRLFGGFAHITPTERLNNTWQVTLNGGDKLYGADGKPFIRTKASPGTVVVKDEGQKTQGTGKK